MDKLKILCVCILLTLLMATTAYANPYRDVINNLTEDEFLLLGQITYCESHGESHACQVGVVITVLNRVMNEGWGDSVTKVVYQKGQFTPAKKCKSVAPTQTELDAIEEVRRNGGDMIQKYINESGYDYDVSEIEFFSTDRKLQTKYAKDFVRIGCHDYGRAK